MSFNRRYAISLFVLLGNLAIPFLFVLNKLRLVNELDFGLLATIYLALLLTSLAVSLSVFYCFSSRAAVRFNIYLGIMALVFFSYPIAIKIVQIAGGWWEIYYLTGWLIGAAVSLLGTWIICRYQDILKPTASITAALLLLTGAQAGLSIANQQEKDAEVPTRASSQGSSDTDAIVSGHSDYKVSDRRNIYYLMPDTFPRSDFLLALDILDIRPFEDELKKLGFVVVPRSTSNFHSTIYSLRSTFAMRVLNEQDYSPLKPEHAGALLFDYVNNGWSATQELLKRSGYTIFNAAGRQEKGFVKCDGYCPPVSIKPSVARNKTLMGIISMTPLFGALNHWFATFSYGQFSGIWRETFNISVDDIKLMQREAPFFLFLHAFTPHPPFLFDAECNYRFGPTIGFNKSINLKDYEAELASEMQCALRFIKQQIEHILAKDPTAVIIAQSDHVLRILNPKDVPEDLRYLNWFGNFSALRLPKRCRSRIPENLSNVDTFPLVLSCLGNREIKTQSLNPN